MNEWSSPFNPFNSMKVLLWRKHLEGYAVENYLPPVTVNIDPTNRCNYNCGWCNAFDMMHSSAKNKDMPEDHMIKLVDFLADWRDSENLGPYSACIAGGGEPLLNKGIVGLLERLHHRKLESGVVSNGSLLTKELIEVLARTSRWVGISMDAATAATYGKIKGVDENLFYKVIENIRLLTKEVDETGSECDVCYKYLLHPDNENEIYDAIKLAKELGCHDFHLRPVGWINLTKVDGKPPLTFNTDVINAQLSKAMELENNDFYIYGIRHKFNPDFSPKKNFSRCWAIPLLPTFSADGWVHTCLDLRGDEKMKMCKHFPNPEEILKFWNTEAHKKLIREIDIQKCPRCTFSAYNEAVEKVIIEDRMCRNFP